VLNEQRRELAASHSITSSARAISLSGTSSPSALARLEVDDQLELSRQHNRQVGGFLAFQDAAASPAMQDLIGGRIDFVAEQISTALPLIQSNSVKPIATLGIDRAPGLETLPTAQELGLSGLGPFSGYAMILQIKSSRFSA
jgi:tripartite-type tricarboxylate transporter receptor subunit TctC